jgi:hypothetical protein
MTETIHEIRFEEELSDESLDRTETRFCYSYRRNAVRFCVVNTV